jgi:sugar transferase (PEP-CTERM system associated)
MRIRLLGLPVTLSMAVLAVLEAAIFCTALLAVGRLQLGVELRAIEQQHGPLWPRALVFSAAMAISLLAVGLYSSRQRVQSAGILARVLVAMAAGIVVTALCFNLIPDFWIGRNVLTLATASSAAAVAVLRLGFSHLVDEAPLRRRVLVYGTGKQAACISQLRRRTDQRGFLLTGFVRPEGETLSVPEQRVLTSKGDLFEFCKSARINEIVMAMDDRRRAFPAAELLECRMGGVEVTDLATFLERETGRVRIDVLNPSWLIFAKGFSRSSLRLFMSSLLDFAASVVLLVVSLPVMLATVFAIKLEDGLRAPVFYHQERVGLRGKMFKLLKFRSMCVNAEANGEEHWAQKSDPRVTRVGALIRKLRIDELPQILNVLRGHMSFVGPRPERPQFVANLSQKIPYYMHRHCVKPGITGWAQVCYHYGASDREALEKLEYDLYYIKNGGFMFDLAILVRTAEVVLFGKGAQ